MSDLTTWPLPEVVQFDYTTWLLRYPQFSNVAQPLAQMYFDEATLYCDNTPGSVIPTGPRTPILNMITAHIAQINAGSTAQPVSPIVGRISNASEGSVSVASDMGTQPGTAAWFQQTQYGASAWQAMAGYRAGGRFTPAPTPYLGAGGPWFGSGWTR